MTSNNSGINQPINLFAVAFIRRGTAGDDSLQSRSSSTDGAKSGSDSLTVQSMNGIVGQSESSSSKKDTLNTANETDLIAVHYRNCARNYCPTQI